MPVHDWSCYRAGSQAVPVRHMIRRIDQQVESDPRRVEPGEGINTTIPAGTRIDLLCGWAGTKFYLLLVSYHSSRKFRIL